MQPECSITDLEIPDPQCPVTPWSDWSPCSTTCGRGVQIRTRLLLVEPSKELECKAKKELNQQRECSVRQDCTFDFETAKEVCNLEPDVGACRGSYRRFYYNPTKQSCETFEYGGCRGNQNNFLTNDICMSTCGAVRVTVTQSRPEQLQQQQPISRTTVPTTRQQTTATTEAYGQPVDCEYSDWSEWTPCSVTCGIEKQFSNNNSTSPLNYYPGQTNFLFH